VGLRSCFGFQGVDVGRQVFKLMINYVTVELHADKTQQVTQISIRNPNGSNESVLMGPLNPRPKLIHLIRSASR